MHLPRRDPQVGLRCPRLPRAFALCSLGALLGCLPSQPAQAFAEDICPSDGQGWVACVVTPCPPESDDLSCAAAEMISTFIAQLDHGARSTLHFDATYYLAQAAGFSAREAFTIAAYDEATDVGQFVLHDQQGRAMVDPSNCTGANPPSNCALTTLPLDGVNRNNFASGGVFFHFMAGGGWHSADEGLHPDPSDPNTEPFLAHVRRWAYGLGPLCAAGLTNPSATGDLATGDQCFNQTTRIPASIVGHLPFLTKTASITAVDWVTPLGPQALFLDTNSEQLLPANALSSALPADNVALARLGIYLHVVGDRVSHHRCVDPSVAIGPRAADAGPVPINPVPYQLYLFALSLGNATAPGQSSPPDATPLTANPDFLWRYDLQQCDQLDHAQRHTYETGTDQAQLDPADRTAMPGLALVYSELTDYAHSLGIPSPDSTATSGEVLPAVLRALQVKTVPDRLDALNHLATTRGWVTLPGYAGMTTGQWLLEGSRRPSSYRKPSGTNRSR